MIIEALCNMVFGLIKLLLMPINIPEIPSDLITSAEGTLDTMIESSSKLIDLFMPFDVAKTLLGIVVLIEGGILIYHFVMWILTKIPMAGVSR